MPLMNLKLGNKNNFNAIDHLFEDYAALVTGSAFPRHTALKFEGTFDDMHCYIVNAVNKNEKLEELTRDKIKCATMLGFGEAYVDANLLMLGTTNTARGMAPCPIAKYLIVFTDGRQAILTTRIAESQLNIERLIF